MERHVPLFDIPAFTGFKVIDIVPPIGVVQVVNRGRAEQEFDLVACHSDFQSIDQFGIDSITLGDIHPIHTARECYNGGHGNEK